MDNMYLLFRTLAAPPARLALKHLNQAPSGIIRPRDLQEEYDLDSTSCARTLKTLAERGAIIQNVEGKKRSGYRLTPLGQDLVGIIDRLEGVCGDTKQGK